jgi:hypothetical protein
MWIVVELYAANAVWDGPARETQTAALQAATQRASPLHVWTRYRTRMKAMLIVVVIV